MKPLVQQLPLPEGCSFLAQPFQAYDLETRWHVHEDYELVLITEGTGTLKVGRHTSEFAAGDVYLIGNNIPHQYTITNNKRCDGIVIYFKEYCWGAPFFQSPECSQIRELLRISNMGLKFTGESRTTLQLGINSIVLANGSNRIILLMQCLQLMASEQNAVAQYVTVKPWFTYREKDCIERVFQYTVETFQQPVSLPEVAAVACKSVSSFCHYFKSRTKKTYINFLNEVRVNYACNQLIQTDKPVTDICYESGFNTVAHFHRQFLRIKRTTPLQYRKMKSAV